MKLEHNQKFFFLAGGIFISYFYFGILQEGVTRGKYEYEVKSDNGVSTKKTEKFTYALTLVFTQCLINYIVVKIVLQIWPQGEDKTPKKYYVSVALTYLLAMVSSNMALQWISYPTQVVGKSAKPIPVMILGVLLGKRSYSPQKYLFVLMIVIGVALFMFKDKVPAKTVENESMFGIGEILLLLSLTMDGLTAAIQERMRAESRPSGQQLMRASNAWSTLYLAVAIILSGEIYGFMDFVSRHPKVVFDLIVLGLTSAVGQIFLFTMVSDFGPLVVSIVTTTRKFFTVLASILLFGNVLNVRQWIGASMVFVALFLDGYYSSKSSKKTNGNPGKEKEVLKSTKK